MNDGGLWNAEPFLKGKTVALFGGVPGDEWCSSAEYPEHAAALAVQAIAAVARVVFAHRGRLLVPPEPEIATLAAAIAQDFHEIPLVGGDEAVGGGENQPVILAPWPVQSPEMRKAMAPFFPADLVDNQSLGPENLLLREPEEPWEEPWFRYLGQTLDTVNPVCAFFVGGEEASQQAFDLVTRMRIETGVFVSAGGSAAAAARLPDSPAACIEEDPEIQEVLRMKLVSDTIVTLGLEIEEPEAPSIEPYVPYAALALRFIRNLRPDTSPLVGRWA